MGNRSYEDLTQYPVFPWVIADYKNEQLKLEEEKAQKFVYRDLAKPIGALSNDKLEQFKSKYYEIINKSSNLAHHN